MRKWVLWGHDVADYRDMFDLSSNDLSSSILEYGCGPSGVNVELNQKSAHVISCDTLFCLDKPDLFKQTNLIFDERRLEIEKNAANFDFSRFGSLPELVDKRRRVLADFFQDYSTGKQQSRYLGVNGFPLPFKNSSFDLALSAHYLFADNDKQSSESQLIIIRELARVAKEVRIFPLIDYLGNPSPLLGPVLLGLQQEGYGVEVRDVNYSLQPAGHAMLRVWSLSCELSDRLD